MTNQQWLGTMISAEKFLHWVDVERIEFAKKYSNSHIALANWLQEEHKEETNEPD